MPEEDRYVDKDCLSYWLPRVLASGVPVPRTKIISTACNLYPLFDGEKVDEFDDLCAAIRGEADSFGYPCFLRSGHTSFKHDWKRSCFLERAEDIPGHVYNIAEFCAIADFMGLPMRVWAVREFLPLAHHFTAFNGMPVAREFRFFVEDGKPICEHFYWPAAAIKNPSVPDWRPLLAMQATPSKVELAKVRHLAERASLQLPGAWSVDLAQHSDGHWVLIDCATAARSWHWTPCPMAVERKWPQDREPKTDAEVSLSDSLVPEDD